MTTVALFSHRLARPIEELTGIGRYSVELSRALVARGTYDYVLVAPRDEDPPPGVWPTVPTVRVGGQRRVLQARWRLLGRPAIDALVPGIDLVHSLAPTVRVPARIAAVVTVHDLFPFDQPDWLPRRGRWLFHHAMARLPTGRELVVTPSHHVADAVRDRVGVAARRLHVVPEGVEARFHDAQPDAGVTARHGLKVDGYVLALGSLTARKNTITVVRALSALPPAHRPVLAIAGPDGDATTDMAAEVERAGLGDDVVRLGFVPDEDLPALIASARALVHPSLDEGFGLPVAEALAAGTPVLAADRGSLPEVVGDAGQLLPPTDVAAWADALSSLNDLDRSALAGRARRHATRWTWDAAAAATEAVYARALDEQPV